jgi:ADP-ribosylglycohydrolase
VAEPVPEGMFGVWGVEDATLGRVHGSSRDDDIDFTVLGLHLLETYGAGYTTKDVGVEWRRRLPILQTYTAERAVYANLVRGIPLETAADAENPFREWIGALIRADIFAYAAAGDPRRAALLAYPDAVLSHRCNGIYGALWAAALIASAFTATSPEMSVVESLRHVPTRSRLAAEVMTSLEDYRAGLEWEVCLERLEARHPTMHETHVLNNAGALAAAVLHGDGDFAATVGLAVQAKLDTDSIGATAGSWAGAFLGYDALPKRLVDPLEDLARTAVFGVGDVRISELVERTLILHACLQ